MEWFYWCRWAKSIRGNSTGIEIAGIGVNGGAVIGSVYNRQWRNCFTLKDVGALGGFAVYAVSDATNKMLNICKYNWWLSCNCK